MTAALDATAHKGFEKSINELQSHLCGSLLRTVFGISVAGDTDPAVRKNISLISPAIWRSCADDAKYKLGIVLEGYDKHNGWDNFHHERPVAAQLYSYVPDQTSIFDNLAQRLFKTILLCRIGRGMPYCEGVSPGGKKYYDHILAAAGDKFAAHVMVALRDFEVRAKLNKDLCRTHTKTALGIVRAKVINARLLECLDYLIANIETKPFCADRPEFRKLSAGYIN